MPQFESRKKREYSAAKLRSELINLSLIFFSFISVPALFGSLLRIASIGIKPVMYFHILLVFTIIGVTLVRKKLSYAFRAWFVIVVVFAVGTVGIFNFGLTGNGIPFLFATSIFATLFFNQRTGAILMLLTLLTITGFTIAVQTGKLQFDIDFNDYSYALTSWIAYLLVFVFLGTVIVVILGRFNLFFFDMVENLEKKVEESTEQLKNANRAKSEFLANMSHEIRTPMNGVLGMLRMLANSQLDEEQQHKTNLAKSSAESLLSLINDILDFSKVEAGKIELEIIDFNIHNLFGDVAEANALKAQKKGVEVILDLSNVGVSMVRGDPGRLRQILTNLVGNAVKFTKQGEIVIKAELSESANNKQTLITHVIDSGIGIPEKNIESLFSVFTQVDASTTRKFGGTGLGLSICQKLCELMNGNIQVRSQLGKGSTFEFFVELEVSGKAKPVIYDSNQNDLAILVLDKNTTAAQTISNQLNVWGINAAVLKNNEILALTNANATNIKILTQTIESWLKEAEMFAYRGIMMGNFLGVFCDFLLSTDFGSLCQKYNVKLVGMTDFWQMSQSTNDAQKQCLSKRLDWQFPKPATTTELTKAMDIIRGSVPVRNVRAQEPRCDSEFEESINDDLDFEKVSALKKRGFKVLVVEDNFVNQQVILGIINELGGEVEIAENGHEAIHFLSSLPQPNDLDLVLMDCQMPEMDGYEATKEIREGRAGNENKDFVIIAMTANAMAGDKAKCLAAGMNDYLAKPVEPDRLLGMLYTYLIGNNHSSGFFAETESKSSSPIETDIETDIEADKVDIHEAKRENNSMTEMVFNKEAALKRLMGKEALLKRLAGSFLQSLEESFANIQQAIEAGDHEAVRLHAHTLKGTASNVGGEKLQQASAQLEHAAKDEEAIRYSTLQAEMLAASEELKAELSAFVQ